MRWLIRLYSLPHKLFILFCCIANNFISIKFPVYSTDCLKLKLSMLDLLKNICSNWFHPNVFPFPFSSIQFSQPPLATRITPFCLQSTCFPWSPWWTRKWRKNLPSAPPIFLFPPLMTKHNRWSAFCFCFIPFPFNPLLLADRFGASRDSLCIICCVFFPSELALN